MSDWQHGFEEQIQLRPDALVVNWQDEALSYRVLYQQALDLAELLAEQGIGPEVAVGLLAERSLNWQLGVLAILLAQGVYLPLDTRQPAPRLAQMVQQTRCRYVLLSQSMQPLCQQPL